MISFKQFITEETKYQIRKNYKFGGKDGDKEVPDGYMVMQGFHNIEWFWLKRDALRFVKDSIELDKKEGK